MNGSCKTFSAVFPGIIRFQNIIKCFKMNETMVVLVFPFFQIPIQITSLPSLLSLSQFFCIIFFTHSNKNEPKIELPITANKH